MKGRNLKDMSGPVRSKNEKSRSSDRAGVRRALMMSVRLDIGGEFFDSLRESGCYYVDKTEHLYELVKYTNNRVTLFTRPRRFGKTLTMTMMESFFDIRRDSRAVFEGLSIMDHEDFCAEWMNQYPVAFLSLKDVEGLTFSGAYAMLKATIAEVCVDHSELRKSSKVAPDDIEKLNRLAAKTASVDEVKESLRTLTKAMAAHYGKPAVLLIDEYDVPLAKANAEKEAGERYYPQMLDVIRGILSQSLKSNPNLKFAVITGCLRITKESIFNGVNHFAAYSVLDEKFSDFFGFTQDEVDLLIREAGLEQKRDTIRRWYNGYLFGSTAVYCPWDVVNYAADLVYSLSARPKNYWKNTSGNAIIGEFVAHRDFGVDEKFETLMNGGTIMQNISDEMTYDSLYETEDNLWSVLVMTGYLTKADPDEVEREEESSYDEEEDTRTALRIPNKEIATIFRDSVVKYFRDHIDEEEQSTMMKALWSGDEALASKAISDLLWKTISYMDYHEDYYHAFLTGIFVGRGRGYGIESNKELGVGRPDIKLTDKRNRRIIIIEAKKSVSKAQMDHDCDEALQQIVDREYAKGLEEEYQVICYGVAFYRKSALVKKLN